MTLYTIRPNFTVILGSNTYTGGQQVDLNEQQFEFNKHKLEGVESDVVPLVFNSDVSFPLSDTTSALVGTENIDEAIALLSQQQLNLDAEKKIGSISPAQLPNPLPAANAGEFFLFNADGIVRIDGKQYEVQKNDRLRCLEDNTVEGDETKWEILLAPKGRSPFFSDPIDGTVSPIGDIYVNPGQRLLLRSIPPEILVGENGGTATEEFPEGAFVAQKGTQALWGRIGNQALILNQVRPLYSYWFRGLKVDPVSGNNTKFQISFGEVEIFEGYQTSFAISRLLIPSWTKVEVGEISSFGFLQPQEFDFPLLLQSNSWAYVYLDINGVGYDTEPPTAETLNGRIYLGLLKTEDNTTISQVDPFLIERSPEVLQLLLFGGFLNPNKLFPQPIAGTLQLSFPGGTIKAVGRNHFSDPLNPHDLTIPAVNPLTWDRIAPDGTVIAAGETNLNFTQYWTGTATGNVPNNDATLLYLYFEPPDKYRMLLSQNFYNSLTTELYLFGKENPSPPDFLKGNSLLIAAILGISNASDSANLSQIVIRGYRLRNA